MKRILSLSLLCLSLVFSGKNYAIPGDLPTINSFNSTWTILEFINQEIDNLTSTFTIANLTFTAFIDIDLSGVFTVLEEIEDDIFESLTIISDKFNSTWTILEFISQQLDNVTVTIENLTVTAVVDIDLSGVFTVLEEIEDDIFESLTVISDKFNSTWTILEFISQQIDTLPLTVTIENLTVTVFADVDLSGVFTMLETIEDHVICFQSQPIAMTTTITQPGTYCLINSITGGLVIASNDVTLDLQGFVISGGTTGIEIGAFSNITIKNGTVRNASGNGIQATGSSDLELLNLKLKNNGMNGVLFNAVKSSLIQSCLAAHNGIAGFSLQDSDNNTFKNCSAIANGINGTSSAFGFVSDNGHDNIFECCTAQETITTQTTSDFIAAGFALTSSEECTKIINCESFDNTATGSAIAYGVYLQSTQTQDLILTDSVIFTIGNIGQLQAISWAPSGTILAAGNIFGNLQVYSFTNNMLSFVTSVTDPIRNIKSLDWSPNGQFLAEGSDSNLIVYSFDGTSLIFTASVATGFLIETVAWSPDGQFLAISGNRILFVYSFNGASLTPVDSVNDFPLGGFYFSTWSPDEQFIALYNQGAVDNPAFLRVYFFDGSSLILVDSLSNVPSNNASLIGQVIDWSPKGNFIALGGTPTTIQIYSFDNFTLKLIAESIPTPIAGILSINWSPDGQSIAAGENQNYIQHYAFLEGNLTLLSSIKSVLSNNSGFFSSVEFSPNGNYLAAGTAEQPGSIPLLQVYSVAQTLPNDNIINDNVVYCNGLAAGSGVGILGSPLNNLIINNIAYQNTLNYQLGTSAHNVQI